jgi:hypothetical protein
MELEYSVKFLQILSSIVLAGLVIFLFPNAELPSYITITFGVTLSFLFLAVQSSKILESQTTTGIFSKIKSFFGKSYISIFIILMLLSLISIFSFYHKKIYDITPPQEFTKFKWVSYILLVFQMGLLFVYLKNMFLERIIVQEGKSTLGKVKKVILENTSLLLTLLTLMNSGIAIILYVIIAKFTTDG